MDVAWQVVIGISQRSVIQRRKILTGVLEDLADFVANDHREGIKLPGTPDLCDRFLVAAL
jgi:hypothetical protein